MRTLSLRGLCAVVAIGVAGCGDCGGGETSDAAGADRVVDASSPDRTTTSDSSSSPDTASRPDAARPDGQTADGSVTNDAWAPDTSTTPDASNRDAATVDTLAPDSAAADAATPDTSTADASTPDTSTPDSASADSGAADATVVCTGNWDPAQNCAACLPGFAGTDCATCVRYVKVDGDDSHPADRAGKTWFYAYANLQSAIAAASAARGSGSCEVWVKAGTYHVYDLNPSHSLELATRVPLHGSFAGTEVDKSERSFTTPTSILDGRNVALTSHAPNVVIAQGMAGVFAMSGFIVQQGQGTNGGGLYTSGSFGSPAYASDIAVSDCHFSNNSATAAGGGMYAYLVNATLTRVTFTSNTAATKGGGLHCEMAHVVVAGATFTSNSVTGATGMGGAIFSGGTLSSSVGGLGTLALSVASSTFSNNTANGANGAGGAIYSSGAATLDIGDNVTPAGSTFEHNEAGLGGGGAVAIESAAAFKVFDALFLANRTTLGGYGGAIRASSASTIPVTISRSKFIQNAATAGGGAGALFLSHASGIVSRVMFLSNASSADAGAVWVADSSIARFENVLFAGNVATGADSRGGAVFVYAALPAFANCTFARNGALGSGSPVGGGLATGTSGVTTLLNTIFWKNSTSPGTSQGTGTTITSTNCLDVDSAIFPVIATPSPSAFESVGTNVYIIQGVDSSPSASFFTPGALVGNYLHLGGARTEVLEIVVNEADRMNAFCDGNNMGAFASPQPYDVDTYQPDSTSSAIVNVGTVAGAPTVDILGRTRSGQTDLGAFEYIP